MNERDDNSYLSTCISSSEESPKHERVSFVISLELCWKLGILSQLFQPVAGSQSGNNGSRVCFTFLTYQWCQFMNSSVNLWRYKPSVKNKKTTTFMYLVTHKRSEYVLFRQFPRIPVSRITDSTSCLWALNNDSKAEFPDSCTKTQTNKQLPSSLFLLLCLLKGQVNTLFEYASGWAEIKELIC